MEPLEKRFNDWLNSAAGAKTKENITKESVKYNNTQISDIQKKIQRDMRAFLDAEQLPFYFEIMPGEPVVDGTRISFPFYFGHETAMRDGFSDVDYINTYGTKPDLIFLFNNGWSYDESRAPFGDWNGQHIRAWNVHRAERFVQEMAKYIEALPEVQEVEYDSQYDD